LTASQAAAYLALGSRWAIYRLVTSGQLPALKVAGKLRIDREDLDGLIEALKTRQEALPASGDRVAIQGVPSRLAPLRARRASRRSVTAPVTRPGGDA